MEKNIAESINSIEEYIQSQSKEIQPVLKKLRRTIKNAAPKAIEKISWEMPTFWQGENLIHFAVFKKHISIFPGALDRIPFKRRLKGYETTKGSIHFPLGKPVDFDLIADITRFRVSVVSGNKSK